MVQVRLHSSGTTSQLPPLLLGQILPVRSLIAACKQSASLLSVERRTCTSDHETRLGHSSDDTRALSNGRTWHTRRRCDDA